MKKQRVKQLIDKMVKWVNIVENWKEEKPKHFWTHWFHDTCSENTPWWANVIEPMYICRTCKVWWTKK